MSTYPTHVVADSTERITLDRGPDNQPLTAESARAFAAELNEPRRPQYRTWRVFRLVPDETS